MRARDPEVGIDDVLVFAELVRRDGLLERAHRLVVLTERIVDAPEMRKSVEVVIRAWLDRFQDSAVVLFGRLELLAVEVNPATEQQRVPVKVRVEVRFVRVEELE